MKLFKLIVSTPKGNVLEKDAVMLSVRGTEGSLAVMAGHIPFITSVVKCTCTLWLPDGIKKTASTEGGLLTVSSNEVTFVSGSFKLND